MLLSCEGLNKRHQLAGNAYGMGWGCGGLHRRQLLSNHSEASNSFLGHIGQHIYSTKSALDL